jgi:O-antigen ligase
LLVVLRRVLDREYVLRWTWSHVLLAAFALWGCLSPLWAGDAFAAMIGSAHLVGLAALLWAGAQLVRSWLRLRLVAALCFGLLLVYAAQGIYYRFVELPALRESFAENEETIRIQRGWEADSFQWRQFKQKITSGEMIGFNASPNTFAAVIVLLTVVSAGVALQRVADRDEPWWAAGVAVGIPAAVLVVWWTRSRTALALLLLAGVMLAALYALPALRRWLGERSRTAYVVGLVAFLLGVAALVGHGLYHGTLFHDSLNFRWRYWSASGYLFGEHPVVGVGWNNFGANYLAHRLPVAAEEIKDPHNFLVRGFTELGLIGGALLVAWVARLWWELTRPATPPPPRETTVPSPYGFNAAIWTFIVIAGLGMTIGALAGIDWAQDDAWVFLEVVERALYACLLVAGGLVAVLRSSKRQELDDRAAPWVLYGLLVGLGVFFLHNPVDMSLFETGPMTLFALAAGAAGGVRMPTAAGHPKRTALAAAGLAVGVVAWVTAAALVAVPVGDSQRQAARADEAIRTGDFARAFALLRDAYYRVPANADYALRAANALVYDQARPEEVRTWLSIAIAADPTEVAAYLARAQFEMRQPQPDAAAVRSDYETVLRLNPNDVGIRLEYAAALFRLGLADEAAGQYRAALAYNDQLSPDEPKRLPPARAEEIRQQIERIAPTTAPAPA